MINIFQPSVGKEELEAVEKVFKSKWGGSGDRTLEFENQFGGRLNSKYSLKVSIFCNSNSFIFNSLSCK